VQGVVVGMGERLVPSRLSLGRRAPDGDNGPMRELIVLGTASQTPTRHRNHNGYLLRWDEEGILFDPGEGTQRQLLMAGVSPWTFGRICITHLHGDHCLGLPGVIQWLSLDRVTHPVEVLYPSSGQVYIDRLLHASVFEEHVDVRQRPVAGSGVVDPGPPYALVATRLDHVPDTFGWRLEEPPGRTMIHDRLEAAGVVGPAVGELQRAGVVDVGGRRVRLEEMSVERPGQVVAFIMDTGLCDAAFELAEGADLVVCEATFASAETELARQYHHLTAGQAGRIAAEAGARRLLISHFSQRYPDETILLDEARAEFDDVVAARDLLHVPVPSRLVADSGPGPAPPR
jgi:ribonuclease Z